MRWRILVALAFVAASLVAVVVAACSGTDCTKGTLRLDIALSATAPLADTITVIGQDANAMLDESFPHTPDPTAPGIEHTSVTVTFPDGYPADTVIHLLVKATGGVTLLGANTLTIHLDPTCSVGDILVSGGVITPGDGGMTD